MDAFDIFLDVLALALLAGVGAVLRYTRKRPPGPGEKALEEQLSQVIKRSGEYAPKERTNECRTGPRSSSRHSH